MSPQVFSNVGRQTEADGLSIYGWSLVFFGRGCVALRCGNNLWHTEDLHREVNFFV